MAFREDFLKVVHGEPGSLYEAFVQLSKKSLPLDADARYQYLRSPQGKFIARDDADVDVYTVKVANRHVEKFKWLYDGLYNSYSDVFSKDIDVVVWGCGCGLDLLALYDRACAQENPQLWMKVRHVTLVDASSAALKRAEQIAQILFPLAENCVQTVQCDLTKPEQIAQRVCLRQLNAYVPRVHLVSNLLDLFDDAAPFARAVKERSARRIGGYSYFNELVVAFSPEYRGGKVSDNIATFRKEWGINSFSEDIKNIGNEPLNCESCSFAYRTLATDGCFKSYMRGRNHALNSLVAKCNLIEPWFNLHNFVTALSKLSVNGENFFKVYRWVETCRFRGALQRIVFVPNPEFKPRPAPLSIEMVSDSENTKVLVEKSAERAFKALKERRDDEAVSIDGTKDDFAVRYWNGGEIKSLSTVCGDFNKCNGKVDYSLYFRIDPGDAEPLPDLDDKMDPVQRELIFSRAQYRKIRGDAGCGKSTTMMWHAIMSVLRTHLPVLLVCKTVTLFSRNEKRMAATLLQKVPGLDFVDSDLVKFMTLDKVLCKHSIEKDERCILKRCYTCKGCGSNPKWDCALYDSIGRNWRKLNEDQKRLCCEQCVKDNVERFARKGSRSSQQFQAFGAVMIDEVQSVSPKLVQAVVNLTFGGNPARECYVFCDERQSLNRDAVEVDPNVGKLRVITPDRGAGYGNWVNLNRPYRISQDFSGRLLDVAARLQSKMIAKYGDLELARFVGGGQMSLSGSVFRVRKSSGDLLADLRIEMRGLRQCGARSITIICDDSSVVRTLLRDSGTRGWLATHSISRDHAEDRRLRMSFREQDEGVQITTVTLAQGWDFKNVIFVVSEEEGLDHRNVLENVLTGSTRATSQMRILDRTTSSWLYNALQDLNN